MGALGQDLRFAARLLVRAPAFTVIAILALALGIGAGTTVFTVVNSVLLRPLGFRDPDGLVMGWENNRLRIRKRNVVSPANYRDWRAQSASFSGMSIIIDGTANVTGGGNPEEVRFQAVEPPFLPPLGVEAAYGQTFLKEDAHPNEMRAAILSHAFWIRRYGGDPAVLGRTIVVDGRPVNVVGVMPAQFPALGSRIDLWTAYTMDPGRDYRLRSGRYARVIARLKPGVSIERVQSEMSLIGDRLEKAYPKFNTNWGVTVVGIHDQVVGGVRTALFVFLGAVALVLLIACSNVANMLMARAATGEREMAIRLSLGAARSRLIRQLLTESVLLALGAAGLGVLLAFWGLTAVQAAHPNNLPRLEEITLDWRALAFTVVLSIATGILFALAPAWFSGRISLNNALKEADRNPSSGRSGSLRNLLVVGPVTLSLVPLAGAGLLIRSFVRLQAVDPGFQPHNVLTLNVNLPDTRYSEPRQRVTFFRTAVERVQKVPGVSAASAITFLPFAGMGAATDFRVVDKPVPRDGAAPVADVRVVPGLLPDDGHPAAQGTSISHGRVP